MKGVLTPEAHTPLSHWLPTHGGITFTKGIHGAFIHVAREQG